MSNAEHCISRPMAFYSVLVFKQSRWILPTEWDGAGGSGVWRKGFISQQGKHTEIHIHSLHGRNTAVANKFKERNILLWNKLTCDNIWAIDYINIVYIWPWCFSKLSFRRDKFNSLGSYIFYKEPVVPIALIVTKSFIFYIIDNVYNYFI